MVSVEEILLRFEKQPPRSPAPLFLAFFLTAPFFEDRIPHQQECQPENSHLIILLIYIETYLLSDYKAP